MQVKTWLQRLTDESNLWFSGVKAEDEGNFLEASSYYVDDATRCLELNLVRSALSCTCAANCLMQLGAQSRARILYALAARIYVHNSEVCLSSSIREALWSLQEALENFLLAGDYKESEHTRKKYVALASRTSPFSKSSIHLPAAEKKKSSTEATPSLRKNQPELPKDLSARIDKLVELHRKMTVRNDAFDPGYVIRAIDSDGGSKLNEKSIAS